MSCGGIVGTADAIAIALTGPNAANISVPDVFGALDQRYSRDLAVTATAAPPNRHSVAPVACSENIEKFTPASSQVAPSGYGVPGRILNLVFGILKMTLMASRTDGGNRCGCTG